MTRRVGPWTVVSERVVYDNPWIRVIDHDVRHPGGAPGQYGVVRFKNLAVGVLAVDADGALPLVGQHRFPLDAYSWEAPEGGGPLDVDPLDSARRELREETGYEAREWLELARFDISNSVTDERAVCFLAWDLTPGAPAPEPSEALAYDRAPFGVVHDRVLNGEITDSLTVVMVLKTAALARAGRLPAALEKRLARGQFAVETQTSG